MNTVGVIAVGLLFVVGCGGTVKGSSESELGTSSEKPVSSGTGGGAAKATASSGTGGAAANAPPLTGGAGGAAKLAPATPGEPGHEPVQGASGVAIPSGGPCFYGDVGPASPELFSKLNHEQRVCDGQGSDCYEIVEFRADCGLMFQVNNNPRNAVVDAADCAALARFATSELLFDALNDTVSCLPGSGNPMESTEIELTTGPGPRKKTSLCQEEPLVSLRACLQTVETKYFPTSR